MAGAIFFFLGLLTAAGAAVLYYLLQNRSNRLSHLPLFDGDTQELRIMQQALLSNIHVFIVYKDKQLKYTKANSAYLQFLEAKEEEIIGKSDADFFSEETARLQQKEDKEVLRNHSILNTERYFTTRKGVSGWFLSSNAPFYDAQHQIAGVISVSIDITEQKATQLRAIKESESNFFEFVNNLPQIVFEIDSNARFTFMNDYGLEYFGYKQQELESSMLLFDVFHADEREKLSRHLKRLLSNELGESAEYTAIRRDGSQFPVLHYSNPVLKDNDIIGFRGLIIDISERKQTEELLKYSKGVAEMYSEQLEERNQELEDSRLEVMNMMEDANKARQKAEEANTELQAALIREKQLTLEAEKANRSKSEFLANMSHEIRTPMNGVMAMTHVLLTMDLTAEQNECAETIKDSADALLTIINDILDFSKIEAGKLELEQIEFDLRTTIENMIDILAVRISSTQTELINIIDKEVPSLLIGDPGRLRQILTNLIGNSIKFTPQGEIILKVSLLSQDASEATILFEVKDTGIGIEAQKTDLLFQSFTQADSSTTRKYGGTGLGLTISKQLVEMMGGEIGVESELNVGSRFWFSLPLKKQSQGVDLQKPSAVNSLQDIHILIVDDNYSSRSTLASLLSEQNARVGTADNAHSAIRYLKQAVYDDQPAQIAILDKFMPGIDGETLGKQIKSNPILKNTALVLLTAMGERGDAMRFSKAGFAAYLTKPVRQSQLYNTLLMVLGHDSESSSQPSAIITRHHVESAKNEMPLPDKKDLKILLVEDNQVNQKVALKVLSKIGLAADIANNGREAIQILEQNPYDLVLMDCQMPEMDGYDATRHIRSTDQKNPNQAIPIIAMTANAMKGDREKCINAGMNDYIAKPIDIETLSTTINKWIRQEQTQ